MAAPVHEKLALLLATSGSTGSPKLVRLSRENVESNARAIREYLKLDETERPITTLPMQYTYGLSILNSHLLAGGCILMTKESCVQEGFWKFFREQKATSLGGVPYTYQILKRLRFFEQEFPWLRSMTQAGGKLPADLVTEVGTWAQARGIRFYVMYGQTEATARMSYLPPEDCLKKPGSIGIPVPGGKFSLLGEDGEPVCGTGVDGELIYEGANVSLGYAKNKEDLMRGDENRGVLHTGDIARRDADGYYYIAGRKKRFIKLYGGAGQPGCLRAVPAGTFCRCGVCLYRNRSASGDLRNRPDSFKCGSRCPDGISAGDSEMCYRNSDAGNSPE